jgi:hypothetical protein
MILDRELHLDRLFAALDLSEAPPDTQHRSLSRIALTGRRRTCEQRLNFAQLFAKGRVLHRDLTVVVRWTTASPVGGAVNTGFHRTNAAPVFGSLLH